MTHCTKKGWSSLASAKRKLAEIRRKRDRSPLGRKVESRVYKCPDCLAYHITSHDADYTIPSHRKPLRVIESVD